ncbi:hypothetical protein MCERE19_02766 [Spirosomataceae bacterium]
MKQIFLLAVFFISNLNLAIGQVSKNSEIFLALKKQDSVFFERSFNLCDMDYLKSAIHQDLTFYHDQAGIQNRDSFLLNTKNNICSDFNKKPIRKIIEESLEVYPMYNEGVIYGAVQTGIHDFYIRESNKADIKTSTAKFIHLYLLVNGNWLLKEVISFDHK